VEAAVPEVTDLQIVPLVQYDGHGHQISMNNSRPVDELHPNDDPDSDYRLPFIAKFRQRQAPEAYEEQACRAQRGLRRRPAPAEFRRVILVGPIAVAAAQFRLLRRVVIGGAARRAERRLR
jgi:hypothetical protein